MTSSRALLLVLVLLGLTAPAAATAQLPELPPPPTLPVPVPVPPVPPAPALPVQPPAAATPAVPVAPPSAPLAPATAAIPAPSAQAGVPSVSPSVVTTSNGTSPTATAGSRGTPQTKGRSARRPPAILLGFRSALPGRVRITVTQVSPVCRSVGRLVVNAHEGRNRVRFAGRIDGRRLRDGTYIAETPSGEVRFAIVRGRPTRNADRFAPSVCHAAASSPDSSVLATRRTSTPGQPSSASGVAGQEASGSGAIPDALPRVLSTSAERAAEVALSLHPVFYLLLGFAIAALAAATVPSRAVPAPVVGAVLARRRAEITLAGTLALLAVLASYWVALVSG